MRRAWRRGSETILLVEDEPAILDMLVEVLGGEGYATLTAPDGMAALELLAHRVPDLVLTDAMMPRLDGPGLVRRMREEPALGEVPVVLTSAVLRPDVGEVPGVTFLAKPFDLDELLAAITAALGRPAP